MDEKKEGIVTLVTVKGSDKEDVIRQIREIIAETLDINEADIALNSHLEEDLGANSENTQILIAALESDLDTIIPDEVVGNLKTVQDVVNHVIPF